MVAGEMMVEADDHYFASTGSSIQLLSRQQQSRHEQQCYQVEQQMQQQQQQQKHYQPYHLNDTDYIHSCSEKTHTSNCSIKNNNISGRRGWCFRFAKHCKGSIYLAFSSHFCFVIGCLFYTKLSLVNKAWIQYTMVDNDLPSEILVTDDDVVWITWASENQGEFREPLTYLHSTRLAYDTEYTIWCTLGASFFALVGALDWARYGDRLNIVMILAGLAGVLSGNSKSSRTAAVWDVISVHLFFLESITLLKRVHNYPAHVSVVNSNASMVRHINQKENEIVDVGDHYLESSGSSGSGGLNGICSSMDGALLDATTYIDENEDDFPFFRLGDLFFFLGSMLDVSHEEL